MIILPRPRTIVALSMRPANPPRSNDQRGGNATSPRLASEKPPASTHTPIPPISSTAHNGIFPRDQRDSEATERSREMNRDDQGHATRRHGTTSAHGCAQRVRRGETDGGTKRKWTRRLGIFRKPLTLPYLRFLKTIEFKGWPAEWHSFVKGCVGSIHAPDRSCCVSTNLCRARASTRPARTPRNTGTEEHGLDDATMNLRPHAATASLIIITLM
eukprot:184273_1